MGSYEILPIGTKLKNLRKKYNVKQDDVSGKDVTRNLISQIEHGKANLTTHAAQIVLKNLKNICDKKHITVSESIEYLMEDEKTQASKILDSCIKELKDLMIYKDTSFVNKLTEVEEFLVNWNLPDKKILVFELAGDYFSNINDLYNSSVYYEKAKTLIDINIYNENFLSILRKLSMVYFYMGKYNSDINCCNFALNKFKNINKEYSCIFLFNSSICYAKLGKYDIALEKLNKLENSAYNLSKDKYHDVLTQKAICFQCLKKYRKSLDIYDNLLNCIDKKNYERYISILINITEINIAMSDFKSAKSNLNLIINNINNINETSKYLPTSYVEISKIYRKLGDLDNSEKYYLKSLSIAQKCGHNYLIKDIFLGLINIYKITNNVSKVSKIKDDIFTFLLKEDKIENDIIFELEGIYLNIGDMDSLKEIHNFVKKFI